VDSLVVRFYRGKDLIYSARLRAGPTPATGREVFERLKHLKTVKCPFTNLPELTNGRCGRGLTGEKMKECVWLKQEAVARVEFLEWTWADHLRHTKWLRRCSYVLSSASHRRARSPGRKQYSPPRVTTN
jgi:ATP-dependent DNA ligase